MSYTFYVDGWSEQPTVENKKYIRDIFNETEESVNESTRHYYPEAQQDSDGWFIMEKSYVNPFPELTIVNGHLTPILNTIGIQFDHCGDIPLEYIGDIQKSIFKAINIETIADKNELETEHSGNFTSFGIDGDRIREKLTGLCEVLKFAKEHKKDVYWG